MTHREGYISYIVNPKSGASSNKRLVSGFKQYLDGRGRDVRVNLTQSLEHTCELAAKAANDSDCGLIVAAGGDGTLREITQGMKGTDKPLIPIPCGTENLLANELGFDLEVQTLIAAYEGNVIKPLDLGCANGKIFTSIAGVGFDGIIIKRMHEWRTGHISHLDYFWPIWRTFWEYTFPPIKVLADGQEVYNGPGLAFIGNISRYAIGLHILKHADYGDGKLDLCIFKCKSQGHLMKHSVATVMKLHTKGRDCHYQKAESFEISSPVEGLPSQIDGDPGPDVPINIHVIPGAIQVMVPPKARPAGIRTRLRRMIG